MKQVNIYEAKTQLSRLVAAAGRGESFIIAKGGTPLAKLVPLETVSRPKFPFGVMTGEIRISDDFDSLPDDILVAFEGSEDH